MVRSPLVWLGEPDPIASMDRSAKRTRSSPTFASSSSLWLAYDLGLDTPYTTSRIIESRLCMRAGAQRLQLRRHFKQFLLRVAASKGATKIVSAERWDGGCARSADGSSPRHRLISGHERTRGVRFNLKESDQQANQCRDFGIVGNFPLVRARIALRVIS